VAEERRAKEATLAGRLDRIASERQKVVARARKRRARATQGQEEAEWSTARLAPSHVLSPPSRLHSAVPRPRSPRVPLLCPHFPAICRPSNAPRVPGRAGMRRC